MIASLRIGERVKIHPACDWYMRGATHGTVTRLATSFAYVRLERIGPKRLRAKIPYDLLARVNEDWLDVKG